MVSLTGDGREGEATIANHTTCDGGDARDWSDDPLSLSLTYNGETVGSETVWGKGAKARVGYRT